MATDPYSSGCENYRTLRTQVFHAAERRLAQVIVITSAVEGEGKTSTALNLAFAIAQSKEKRVLVIDGDLRRPEIARHLGLDPEKGLGQTLNGECDTMRAVIHIANSNLYLLPASNAATNPTELLSSERLGETLTELRRYFDFILIDSPPVAPFADARLLAHQADAVMMVVRAGAAPYGTVEHAIAALPPGRFLGVVLNDANQAHSASHYGKRRFFDWLRFGKRKQPKR
jgi:capsular exopolysaccharide synthesis family protein